MPSLSEENYLKAIFVLEQDEHSKSSTNAIAEKLETKASSVTAMLKKLSAKDLVKYEKYQAVELTAAGRKVAITVLRKHRLWEYFLYEKLKFNWSEVHELAEQLEHIQSAELTDRLDRFLGNPRRDPHGDPIPDRDGHFPPALEATLNDLKVGDKARILGVKDHSTAFFNYLKSLSLKLGDECECLKRNEYDGSLEVEIDSRTISLSRDVAENLYIKIKNR
ncbi:MAG: iron-dependent repressor [Flavobacteriales bacterium]|nr:iron-dependent repressor [Flavobacteriales bacterium]|tara:strand:+ start:982 stop:1644 length:663 start_codon:yes stop_codon:yes gene_type:complete